MSRLDDKDDRLLRALARNARASLVSLAREIGLSRSATHDRIARLEETGVIAGYTIVRGEAHAESVEAILAIRFLPRQANAAITARIAKLDGVARADCVSGDIDAMAYISGRTPQDLSHIRDQVSALDGVDTVTTYGILARHGA